MPKPSKHQCAHATELLTRAMLRHHVAPWFLTSPELKALFKVISNGQYQVPTRYQFWQMTDTMSQRAAEIISRQLNARPFFSFEEDSWTRHNKHFHAVTAGMQGTSCLAGTFEITRGSESAVNQAHSLHATLLSALGLNATLPADDTSIPHGKVAAMTSDTANVMPATAKELAQYPLCHNMFWVPCAAHELGLFLKDQMKIQNIKAFLGKAGRIASIFKSGAANKLISTCALPPVLTYPGSCWLPVCCVLYMHCVPCNL
jgi:hypothetical protein